VRRSYVVVAIGRFAYRDVPFVAWRIVHISASPRLQTLLSQPVAARRLRQARVWRSLCSVETIARFELQGWSSMTGSHLSGAALIACFLLSPAGVTLDAVAAAQDVSGAHADSSVAAASTPPAAAGRDVPLNIQVSPVLARVFQEILEVSPTFADQCERIRAAKYVHVRVMPVMGMSTTTRGTARTTMRRFSSRALLASVTIPVPLTTSEYAEFFGHEFEHIIEQIDRVDLEALTRAGAGASRLSDGAYETTRARRVGLTIADESDHPRPVVTPPLQPQVTTSTNGRQR
jgi:hypothetical protein